MIYITGDTHGYNDFDKIIQFFKNTKDKVTKNDYLIILGDVACYFDNEFGDEYVQGLLHNLPCTVLWIDGNHENFNLINKLPITNMFCGKVQVCQKYPDIIHLMRGQVYTIEGKKFFTFGGGLSIDKARRIEGKSWWKDEMPSNEEYQNGFDNLEFNDWEVDYILTHTAPNFICKQLVNFMYKGEEELQGYFDKIATNTTFTKWFFGHWHKDREIGDYMAMYHKVIKLTESFDEQ